MNGYNSNYFNRSSMKNLRTSIQNMVLEDFEQRQAERRQRNLEKKEREAKLDALETQVQQTMRDISKPPPIGGTRPGPIEDQIRLRALAIDQLQQDTDFVKTANELGQSVGQYSGSGSAGRFGYRYDTQKAADAAAAESAKRLFDAEGNARLPDFENKRWNANTGKWEIEMIGKGPSATATQKAADELAAVASGPNADIAAARAMGAAERGDVGFGRRVDPARGTVDDTERYEQLKKQQQERQRQREQETREQETKPRFSVGTGTYGQPVVIRKYDWEKKPPITNVGGSYVNPLTPEGRLINQGWTPGSDGKLTPPDPEKDEFGYLNTPTGRAAAMRDAKADTQRQYDALQKQLTTPPEERPRGNTLGPPEPRLPQPSDNWYVRGRPKPTQPGRPINNTRIV